MHVLDTEPTILAVKNCSKNKSSQKRRRTFNDYSLLTEKGVFMDSSRRSYSNIESDMWELLPGKGGILWLPAAARAVWALKLTLRALSRGTDSSSDSYIFRFWKAFRRTIRRKVCLSMAHNIPWPPSASEAAWTVAALGMLYIRASSPKLPRLSHFPTRTWVLTFLILYRGTFVFPWKGGLPPSSHRWRRCCKHRSRPRKSCHHRRPTSSKRIQRLT